MLRYKHFAAILHLSIDSRPTNQHYLQKGDRLARRELSQRPLARDRWMGSAAKKSFSAKIDFPP